MLRGAQRGPKAAHRVLHAVPPEVQSTHQVVHGRRIGGVGAQEDCRVAQNLAEHWMLESLGHVFIEGRQEQLRELGKLRTTCG